MSRTGPDYDLTQLFEETRNMVYSLGMRLFRNPDEAADFAQDVYVRVLDRIGGFRGESRISTWIYSVAMHLGLNRLRRMRRIRFVPEAEETATEETPETLLSDALDRQETEERIQRELLNLPDSYRVPILLLYFDRLSYRDMSEKLGLPEGTLKSLVHRGKRILRNRLIEKGDRNEKHG